MTTVGTCTVAEVVKYTANFTKVWAKVQTEEVTGSVDADNHAWGEASYTVNDDGTHTANYVCGAEEPVVAGLKGDVTLDGVVDMDDAVKLMQYVLKAIDSLD